MTLFTDVPEVADSFSDLKILETGREKCLPTKHCIPTLQQDYVLHYVENGEGIYILAGQEYRLKARDIFFTPQGKITEYYPLRERPWTYTWVRFRGNLCDQLMAACGLSAQTPVISDIRSDRILNLFLQMADVSVQFSSLKQLGLLYLLFDEIAGRGHNKQEITEADRLLQSALQFIRYNMNFDFTVAQLAENLNISVNYLGKIFKDRLGVAPKQYITRIRLEHAGNMLAGSDIKVKDIAKNLGYSDSLYFYKEFSRNFGCSPSEYRARHRGAPGG